MTQTASHAEREVERARADLTQTLDALREKLSFSEVLDEMRAQFLGSSSGEFTSNLTRQIRENPLPAVMIGAGALMLMMGERRRTRSHTVRIHPDVEHAHRTTHQMGAGLRSATESMREAGGSAAERARSAAQGAGEAIGGMAETVGESVRHAGDSAAAFMHQARDTAQTVRESTGEIGQRTMQSFNSMLDQQPLLIGAIGVALGALVGAMLPRTQMEDELLGETRDQLRDAITEQSGELYERGKVTATEVYRAAADEARQQGLLPEDELGGKPIAEKIEQVVTKAGEAAKQAGQREASEAEKRLGGEPGSRSTSASAGPTGGAGQTAGRQPPESIKPGAPIVPDRPPTAPPARKG